MKFHPNNYLIKRVVPIVTAFVLLLNSAPAFISLMQRTINNGKIFISKSLDDINLSEYGDCNGIGYGYMEKIVPLIPDLNMFPVIRYNSYNRFPHVLFSDTRTYYDNKILIGIDLDEDATQETLISQAVLKSIETNSSRSTWTFQTGFDYDLLTGFIFNFKNDFPFQTQNLEIILYDSAKNYVEIGQWIVTIPNKKKSFYIFNLEKPISHFSFGRGATDFIIVINNLGIDDTSTSRISGIDILGVKVDISSYTIFHKDFDHDERCFAAIKNSFSQEIQDNNLTSWKRYLEDVSNVNPIK